MRKVLRLFVLIVGASLVVLFALSAWKTEKTFTALQAVAFSLITVTFYRSLASGPRQVDAEQEAPEASAKKRGQYILGSAVGLALALIVYNVVTRSVTP